MSAQLEELIGFGGTDKNDKSAGNENSSNIPISPNPSKKKSVEETKKIIENFKEKISAYPRYISYDGSTVLCVMLSMKPVARVHITNLPSKDQELLISLVPQNVQYFSVKFDDEKDFIFFDFWGDNNLTLNFFNAVAHPRAEDLKDVPPTVTVVNDGDKIAVGDKILINKKAIQAIVGTEPCVKKTDEEIHRRQPVANKNAYEIRDSILDKAVDIVRLSNKRGDASTMTDEVLRISKMLYAFVENRR